MGLFGSSKND